jgi:hypothetical protein
VAITVGSEPLPDGHKVFDIGQVAPIAFDGRRYGNQQLPG